MTKLEAIKAIGDVLTKLDIVIGSIELDDPRRPALKIKRSDLDARQRELVHLALDEVAELVKEPMEELQTGTKTEKNN